MKAVAGFGETRTERPERKTAFLERPTDASSLFASQLDYRVF